jgi:hypothetical protein
MNKRLVMVSIVGWLVGLGLVAMVVPGLPLPNLGGLTGSTAGAGGDALFSQEEVLAIARDWAKGYVDKTIGQQVRGDGQLVALAGMDLVDLRFVNDTRQVVTSISSGAGFSE